MTIHRALVRLPAAVAATAALSSAAILAAPTPASAAPAPALSALTSGAARSATTTARSRTAAQATALARSAAVVRIAASLAGRPYRYGASGPRAFDCSGYSKYVYARIGVRLPRTTQQQLRASRRISTSQIRIGDVVFFMSGNYAYHLGIYAGGGKIWHSPRSGSTVRLVKIWTTNWVAGRVV